MFPHRWFASTAAHNRVFAIVAHAGGTDVLPPLSGFLCTLMCVLSFGLAYLRSERGAAFFHLCNRILINQLYNTVQQQNIGLLSVALNSSLHECTKLHTRNKYMIFQEIDRFCWRRLAVVIFCSSQVNSVLLSCPPPDLEAHFRFSVASSTSTQTMYTKPFRDLEMDINIDSES